MNQEALGRQIRVARKKLNMTQEELAAAVDYSVDHMSVIERGVKTPGLDKLIQIANTLGVGTDWLLQEDLDASVQLRACEISEKLRGLPVEGQRKVLRILDTLIDEMKIQ